MPEPGARLFLALVPADAPGHPVLASVASPSFFLIGELLLGNLSETVVVVGNAPHDRPSFLVCHLIGDTNVLDGMGSGLPRVHRSKEASSLGCGVP